MTLAVRGLSKTYPAARRAATVAALNGVDVEARAGELLTVVGPSGSGKTTLLRCIAGLETPDAGTIEIAGRDVSHVPVGRRDVAMVFQEYALYPHLSVGKNIAFGLEAQRVPPGEIKSKVHAAAESLGLVPVLERKPGELSGGERQRVALARSIVRAPALFLMDEPLSNLDAELRTSTRAEIRRLQKQLATTTVYVTHDQFEALSLGHRVAVLRAGEVEQVATPGELYARPANAFVARFIGTPSMNLFPGDLVGSDDGVLWGVRPENIALVVPGQGRVDGSVTSIEGVGADRIVHTVAGGHRFLVRSDSYDDVVTGQGVGLAWPDEAVLRFDEATEKLKET